MQEAPLSPLWSMRGHRTGPGLGRAHADPVSSAALSAPEYTLPLGWSMTLLSLKSEMRSLSAV